MNDANNKNIAYWDEWYKGHYCERNQISSDDWLDYFMPIISEVRGPAIDLGCGSGNDTLYLLNKGKSVIPCDASMTAIQNIRDNFPEIREALCFDMLEKFPTTKTLVLVSGAFRDNESGIGIGFIIESEFFNRMR